MGCENHLVNNLSMLESNECDEKEIGIDDFFPDEQVFTLSLTHTPWYADFTNYTMCCLMPKE